MITRLLRHYTTWVSEPIARAFIRLGAAPNHVTVLGLVLMSGVAALLALGYLRLAGALMLLAAGADGVDGVMARLQGSSSRFGAFFDSTLDRYSEALALLGLFVFFLRQGDNQALVLIYCAIVGSLLVSYTRARAEGIGIECQAGLLTRVERVAILVIALLIGRVKAGLWILAILSNLTAMQRVYVVWRGSGALSEDDLG